MRTTRAAAAIAVIAAVGLVVSLVAAWSSLDPAPTVRNAGQGARPAFTVGAAEPRVDGRGAPGADPGPVSDAAPSEPKPALRVDGVRRSSASLAESSLRSRAGRPARVTIGAIGIDAPVRPVGVTRDGQMQLPADPTVLGWYKYGASLDDAARGSAVLAGHLDSNRFGLGPLVRLREARVGDTVRVTMSDGARASYRVVRITRFDRQGLPARVFSRNGPQRLRLITCGGEFDADAGGYQQNLVVTAVRV